MEHQIGISFPDRVVLRLKCDTESPGWGGVGAGQHTDCQAPAPVSDSIHPQCVRGCVLSHVSRVRLIVTLWTIARQASLSMGFSRQKYWCGLLFPSPGDLPGPRIEPMSPALKEPSVFTSEPPGKPILNPTVAHTLPCT